MKTLGFFICWLCLVLVLLLVSCENLSIPSSNRITSMCPPPPASTPPWSDVPLPLPRLPAQTAVMFSYYVSGASCLAALDAQGARVWSAIVSPIDSWHFDAGAGML